MRFQTASAGPDRAEEGEHVGPIIAALTSVAFIKNAALLLLGAAVTGYLVPVVKQRMDDQTFTRRALFDASLRRQTDVIQAQAKFLREFSEATWDFIHAALKVSYYREENSFEGVADEYDKASWGLLNRVRSTVGAASWLASVALDQKLRSFAEWLFEVDEKISNLLDDKASVLAWETHHDWLYEESQKRVTIILQEVAEDFGIRETVRVVRPVS
jgi:hypothetical protein